MTFAGEATRLVRRLNAWPGMDFTHGIQHFDPGSPQIAVRNRETFRTAAGRMTNVPRPKPGLFIAAPPRQGADGVVCPEPDDQAGKVMTLWLMADLQKHLLDAPKHPAIEYLRLHFEELLDARAWIVVPFDNLGGMLVLAGRIIDPLLLTRLVDAANRLLDSAIDIPVRIVGTETTPPSGLQAPSRGPVAKPKARAEPKVPEKYKAAVRLWPVFQSEMASSRKRATIARFRTWLKNQRKPILLDEQFAEWWNNIYRRMTRRADRRG